MVSEILINIKALLVHVTVRHGIFRSVTYALLCIKCNVSLTYVIKDEYCTCEWINVR